MAIIHLINCVSHAFVIRLLQDAVHGACLMEKSALQRYQSTIKPLCNSFYWTAITDTRDLNMELYSIKDFGCQECKFRMLSALRTLFLQLIIIIFFLV